MEKQEYLIGDIAVITGISRDMLRFYEKKGILTPKKKDNGYRYYTEDDLYLLVRFLFSKRLNMGLDAIKDLMITAPLDCGHQEALRRQIEAEISAIDFHRQTLARLLSIKKIYDEMEDCRGRFCLKTFPTYRVLHTLDSAADGLKQWFLLSQRYDGLDMVSIYDCYRYQAGFSLNEGEIIYDYSQLLIYEELMERVESGYDFSKCEIFRESTLCICTVAEVSEARPSLSVIFAMRQWATGQGLVASPEIYVTCNFVRPTDSCCAYSQEIYIPVIPLNE